MLVCDTSIQLAETQPGHGHHGLEARRGFSVFGVACATIRYSLRFDGWRLKQIRQGATPVAAKEKTRELREWFIAFKDLDVRGSLMNRGSTHL